MTPLQRHCKQWSTCKLCDLHINRTKVVLIRGTRIPAPILFIGEGPGASEDVIGEPFKGPAGHLLDLIIDRSIDAQHDYAITNLVACLPIVEGRKSAEPPVKSIEACAPRVGDIVNLCHPRVIVCVGALAYKWANGKYKKMGVLDGFTGDIVRITHPAAILRMDVTQQGIEVQRAIVIVEDAVSDL